MMIKRCVLWMIGIILFMQMSQAAVKNNVSRFTNNELNRDEWKVSASNIRNENQAPGKAIDDKVNTRWTNGAIQKGGEWFQIDMNSKQSFNEIELFQA
ncbi:discoidin domain-containing protein, partial [Bacteroides xylanisolvens]|uniref:discoidin domain-containing protein n=2 Tax=Bacteroides TaxID=816 RepID=UPI00319DEFAB